MFTCTAESWDTSIPRFLFATGEIELIGIGAVFSAAGNAIGAGVEYYLMRRHCED